MKNNSLSKENNDIELEERHIFGSKLDRIPIFFKNITIFLQENGIFFVIKKEFTQKVFSEYQGVMKK
jgi:hypothetical protein